MPERNVPPGKQVRKPTPKEEVRGIECPRCGCRHLFVVYTRPADGQRVLRRRECRHCGRRIVTYEASLG